MIVMIYRMLQCTWGIFQSIGGLAVFLCHYSCPHQQFHGAVHTSWEKNSGVSLGMFIFTPRCEGEQGEKLKVHEYGHTWQSLILGPLYLPVIGLPSMVWFKAERFRKLRREKNLPYSAFYTEKWADWLGEKVTGSPSSGE